LAEVILIWAWVRAPCAARGCLLGW